MSAEKAYARMAAVYDESFLSKTSQAEDQVIYPDVQQWLKKGKIIDLGCGTATFLDHVNWPMGLYYGLDVCWPMLSLAIQKHPQYTFIQANMNHIIKPQKYDGVISLFGSLSYAAPNKVYHQINELLKPGGRFYLMLYNERYANRPSYILNRHKIKVPWHVGIEAAMALAEVKLPYKTVGFNFFGDDLEGRTTEEIMRRLIMDMDNEIMQSAPFGAYFTILKGEKPAP